MIVRNESHIILKTLENLISYIPFSYWVIVDTGSTDNTKQIIQDFFDSKSIPGELHDNDWVDFGHNRTLALEYAYNKSDYLFIFDADDKICGKFVLPDPLNQDRYNVKMGVGFEYVRPLLITNRKRWCFEGVLHEYLQGKEPVGPESTIDGNYHIISGRSGSRSLNPTKYYDDAIVLENAFYKEQDHHVGLARRYAFYCAQSYKDAGDKYGDKAIEWYLRSKEICSWEQEKYYSSLMLGTLYKKKGDIHNAYKYWTEAIQYDSERIEGVVMTMEDMMDKGLHVLVNMLFHRYKTYKRDLTDKLFLFTHYYDDNIEYHNSVSAYYTGDYASGYMCSKKIIYNNKIDENRLKQTYENILFYKDQMKNDPERHVLMKFLYDRMYLKAKKNEKTLDCETNLWNVLFEYERSELTKYQMPNFKNKENPVIFFSITSCKRLDLFKQTVCSIVNQWTDANRIDYWFCVDDNSSDLDRNVMKMQYPWFDYYMKDESEKGHRNSMNIIWNKLDELRPDYWIHMEDDFLFHEKEEYVGKSMEALNTLKRNHVHQILFNRNYAETIRDYQIIGHKQAQCPNIVMHNHNTLQHGYINAHYWPHYSFRPSMVDVAKILELGNYDSENQFFEMDYANKWTTHGCKTAFFDRITHRHIGKLTSEKNSDTVQNAYALNEESQFTSLDKKLPIKIVNLQRRADRKSAMEQKLQKQNVPSQHCEFISAVDGKKLEPCQDLIQLFRDNDFQYKKGVMGCAISHYMLWQRLVQDEENDFYLILEDDITLCDNFNDKIQHLYADMKSKEVVFMGYSMFDKERESVRDKYDTTTRVSIVSPLNKTLYIGGLFCYSINKNGAQRMLDYISIHGIKHGIDYLFKIISDIPTFEAVPLLARSVWNENGREIDTDIQNKSDCIDFSTIPDIQKEFVFIRGKDQLGNDGTYHMNENLSSLCSRSLLDNKCVGFNSLGFMKSSIETLSSSEYMNDTNDGLYIKRSYYEKHIMGYDIEADVREQPTFQSMMQTQPSENCSNKYAFIHSCHLATSGLTILDELVQSIIDNGLISHLAHVYIINIGESIDADRYSNDKIKIIQLSSKIHMFENCTINIMHDFCSMNTAASVLYLHTKGITYQKGTNLNIEHWRQMMMYYMIEQYETCNDKLLEYDTVGCNCLDLPLKHYSGNFWWANASYINTLDKIYNIKYRHSAEFWLLSGEQANSYEIYASNINHYHEEHPRDIYTNQNVVFENKRKTRVKMLCNWCDSKQLCKEWRNMCEYGSVWKNLEITWEDENIDYYVIINHPKTSDKYVPERTIVFQMEPWVHDDTKNWGVRTWGSWAKPDPTKFLDVRGRHTEHHNNAFWQLELNYHQLLKLSYPEKKDAIASICSSKYFDEGHIHRIDFLKFMDAKQDIHVDIYNIDNTHHFDGYKGPLTPYVDKSLGIVPYKYYFMAENNYERNFITEKLWEPILCETLCFYWGCPNVADHIDEQAFVQLDPMDFEKSYEIIQKAITEDWWTQRIDVIRAEKHRILSDLAFFPTIHRVITNHQNSTIQ